MGFPEDYKLKSPISELYKQVGNSICIPKVRIIEEAIVEQLLWFIEFIMEYEKELAAILEKVSVESDFFIEDSIKSRLDIILDNSERSKGVLTVLITSVVYKYFHPSQDVRYHQSSMQNGYSGRSFDTKYVTPFLRKYEFPSMSEVVG